MMLGWASRCRRSALPAASRDVAAMQPGGSRDVAAMWSARAGQCGRSVSSLPIAVKRRGAQLSQVLGLVLARPPPAGWSAPHPLPRATKAVLPVKASLLVAPAALLPQWEAELHKHTVQGALRSATYVGVGSAPPPPPPPEGEEEEEEESVAAEGERQVGRTKRSRSSVSRYQPGGVSAAAAPAGEADGGEEEAVEVLASTRPGLFVCGAGEACAVEECDVVFCSFETLRDELKVVGRGGRGGGIGGGSARGGAGGGGGMGASPLGTLGFWRIVLDEAQAATMLPRSSRDPAEIQPRSRWIVPQRPRGEAQRLFRW